MSVFIEADDLRKTYRVGKMDVPALRGVSFSVQRGEFISIVGPSGSGKSTLFYLLGGLARADSGRIIIDGDNFSELSDGERTIMRKRKIGFVFQKFNLLPTLDARSNIAIAQDIAGRNGKNDPAHFQKITDLIMPGYDGSRLIDEIKTISPNTPAILLSGKVRIYDHNTHADVFLPKGMYAPVELLERIRVLLIRKRGPKRPAAAAAQNKSADNAA